MAAMTSGENTQGQQAIQNANQAEYVVLARKYRSRTFGELIGQDALVKTLTHAIAANKIHHAYVFTGIRGIGKTSTARLLAMALNCENGPSITWDENDAQVQAIRAGNHVDVFEYDAASNRGVEEVAQLFEGVNYAPVVGRYKIYIIDEVHMLSNHAFNALLKTLEEPPARVKFIFATTEVQKIPVTVLSRCQRFDLKRMPSEVLVKHFTEILSKENIQAEQAAVQMIAKAADGSARDGLSLLDQAIALSHGTEIRTDIVREMLGLADRARVYDVLDVVLGGDSPKLMAMLDDLYAQGQDAGLMVEAMLETVHLLTRLKVVPTLQGDSSLSELEQQRAVPLAQAVGLANLARIYQVLMQVAEDVKVANRPHEALSMGLVQLAYLAPLPPLEKILEQAGNVAAIPVTTPIAEARSVGAMAVQAPAPVAPPVMEGRPPWEAAPTASKAVELPADWAALVRLVSSVKPGLAAALKDRVQCVDFRPGEVQLVIGKGLLPEADLLRDFRTALTRVELDWTVKVVKTDSAVAMPTLAQTEKIEHEARKVDVVSDPAVAAALAMFPGAEVIDVEREEYDA
jgi:DNA polymerase III subunit gamma/tau